MDVVSRGWALALGIDPDRFARALERSDVKAHIARLLNRYAGRKVGEQWDFRGLLG